LQDLRAVLLKKDSDPLQQDTASLVISQHSEVLYCHHLQWSSLQYFKMWQTTAWHHIPEHLNLQCLTALLLFKYTLWTGRINGNQQTIWCNMLTSAAYSTTSL